MLTVIIPDPALREFGGHHPATIESLVNSSAFEAGKIKLEVYANSQCDSNFIDSMQLKNVSINTYFETDFYQYFYQSPECDEHQVYVRQLANEYTFLLARANQRATAEKLVLWFHTLTWLHAQALYLAIKLTKADVANYKIIIGLMYKPNKQLNNGNIDVKHNLFSQMVFKALAQFNNVHLAAADWELSKEYENILNQNVNIQPTALLGNIAKKTNNNDSHNKQVILYCGDAKENKGFLGLPQIIDTLSLNLKNHDIEFIVQYTLTNDQTKLVQTTQELEQLAKQYSNLKVIGRFLSHQELLDMFNSSSMVILNYDEIAYAQQSSGVLWLAVYFNLHIVSFTSTWCERESARLGGQYSLVTLSSNLSENVAKLHGEKANEYGSMFTVKNAYYEQLYSDVGYWLLHGM